MVPQLTQSTASFGAWKRQFEAYKAMKEWDDVKALAVLPAFIHEDILSYASWDGKATLTSALNKLEKAWLLVNRPSNPLQNFEKVSFQPNLYELAKEVRLAGTYINASEETLVRKFISLLPHSLQMAAFQFSTDLSTTLKDLTDHVAKLPMPSSLTTAPVAAATSDESVSVTAGVKKGQARSPNFRPTQGAYCGEEAGIVCFNCGQKNHVSRFCLAPKASCITCGGKHQATFCERINRFRNRSKNAARS